MSEPETNDTRRRPWRGHFGQRERRTRPDPSWSRLGRERELARVRRAGAGGVAGTRTLAESRQNCEMRLRAHRGGGGGDPWSDNWRDATGTQMSRAAGGWSREFGAMPGGVFVCRGLVVVVGQRRVFDVVVSGCIRTVMIHGGGEGQTGHEANATREAGPGRREGRTGEAHGGRGEQPDVPACFVCTMD